MLRRKHTRPPRFKSDVPTTVHRDPTGPFAKKFSFGFVALIFVTAGATAFTAWYVYVSRGEHLLTGSPLATIHTALTDQPAKQRLPVDLRLATGEEQSDRPHGSSDRTRSSTADVSAATLSTPRIASQMDLEQAVVNPGLSGWQSEAFNDQLSAQLKKISQLIIHPEQATFGEAGKLVTDEFTCVPLRPGTLREVYRDDASQILRFDRETQVDQSRAYDFRQAAGLAEALQELGESLAGTSSRHVKLKNIRLELSGKTAKTITSYEASVATREGSIAQVATWECRWLLVSETEPRLTEIGVLDFEEVTTQTPHQVWFVDDSQAIIGANRSYHQQLAHGIYHWVQRIESIHGLTTFVRNGITVGDVNGDGLEDVYVCQPGHLPNRLYVQSPDGTVTDVSRDAGVDLLDQTSSALFLDLDNDGDQDLVAAMTRQLVILENDGDGQFALRNRLSFDETDVQTLTAADYDNDGDVDLYICTDFAVPTTREEEKREQFVFHDANDGGKNYLFQNEINSSQDWNFLDVTRQTGLDVHNRRHSLAAAWDDYDNDGDADLYVANDFGQNCLYRNDDGHFKEVASESGVVDFGSGMSVSWGDFNRDGWMDVYVGNMFSSAGNRITRQSSFRPASEENTNRLYRRFAKGNTLFENAGDGTFHDVGGELAVEMGRWAWSSIFVDLNQDGWEDLVVANGYLTAEDTVDL